MRSVFVAFVDHSQEAVENYEQSQNQAPNEFAAVISQLWQNKKSEVRSVHSVAFQNFQGQSLEEKLEDSHRLSKMCHMQKA